jgi:superfamily II DNA or RNA helicase
MNITKKGYTINKCDLSKNEIDKLKKELQVTPKINDDYGQENISFNIYRETDNTISIPRYFGTKKYGNCKYTDTIKKANFKFLGELRDTQKDVYDTSLNKILNNGGGLISLCCGGGKTVISLALAVTLKLKTLVLVHKTFLLDQWVERIQQFTNAKIGTIRQKKIDVKRKDIVVGMLQSISMIDYDPSIFDEFGLVIYDECHHVASRVYSNALFKTGCKYTIGLSATPERADGMTHVIHSFLGESLYKLEMKPNKNVCVTVFHYISDDNKFKEIKTNIKGYLKPSSPIMITNICEIESRNNFIVEIINVVRKLNERKILILSGRIAHLEILKNKVDAFIKSEEQEGLIEENEFKTSFYFGKSTQKERKDAELNADIIFASFEMAHEGLDIDRLNTIILASPKSSIIQAIGRIMRKEKTSGRDYPLIIDMSDNLSMFPSQGLKRRKHYVQNNYKIFDYYSRNDKVVLHSDFFKNKYKNNDNLNIPDTTTYTTNITQLYNDIDDTKKDSQITTELNNQLNTFDNETYLFD